MTNLTNVLLTLAPGTGRLDSSTGTIGGARVTVSLGFVLLDAHWRSVFVNDAARDALVNAPSGQTAPDTIESALQKLEELITVSLTDGKPPLGFTLAVRRCRTFPL